MCLKTTFKQLQVHSLSLCKQTVTAGVLPVWGPAEWWGPGAGESEAAARSPSRTRRHLPSWTTTAARWCCTVETGRRAGTSSHKPDRTAPPHPLWLHWNTHAYCKTGRKNSLIEADSTQATHVKDDYHFYETKFTQNAHKVVRRGCASSFFS